MLDAVAVQSPVAHGILVRVRIELSRRWRRRSQVATHAYSEHASRELRKTTVVAMKRTFVRLWTRVAAAPARGAWRAAPRLLGFDGTTDAEPGRGAGARG